MSVWELRKGLVGFKLSGHSNTITGLAVSPDGHHLLTNSMDNTLRVWDMRPFAPANRYAVRAAGLSASVRGGGWGGGTVVGAPHWGGEKEWLVVWPIAS